MNERNPNWSELARIELSLQSPRIASADVLIPKSKVLGCLKIEAMAHGIFKYRPAALLSQWRSYNRLGWIRTIFTKISL
jgi:hypothetical protein